MSGKLIPIPETRTKQSQLDTKRLSSILFQFLIQLREQITSRTDVVNQAFYFDGENPTILPDFADIESICFTETVFESTLIVQSVSERIYAAPFSLDWSNVSIASEFRDKPPNPDSNIYEILSNYAFPFRDEQTEYNVVLFDATPDHEHLDSHPHHLHRYRRQKKLKAENFSGLISDMTRIVVSSIR